MPTRRNVVRGIAAFASVTQAQAQTRTSRQSQPQGQRGADFTPFTTLHSASSGEHWVTPFGIPFRFGKVPAAKRDRIFARYPKGPQGLLYPVQTEQFKVRADGTLIHCTGHVKLPADYAARHDVEIGFSDSAAPPPAPNWERIATDKTDLVVRLSTWEPRIHWLALSEMPNTGDEISIEFADSKGKLTYRRVFDRAPSYRTVNDAHNHVWDQLAKQITQDPNGRYCCYDPTRLPLRESRAGEPNADHFKPMYANSIVMNDLGLPFGYGHGPQNGPRRTLDNPRGDPSERWNPKSTIGMYIWSRRTSGDPERYSVRVRIKRAPSSKTAFFADEIGTLSIDGVLKPCAEASRRESWIARFDRSEATPDSPWFSGSLMRQVERRAAFTRVSDGAVQPHLEAWFRVSYDAAGTVIDRQVSVENSKAFASARDYFYDAEVLVDGRSQTRDQPRRYENLFHGRWETWRWAQNKPFGMCDVGDFMRARLIFPWTRYPTEDHTDEMACKLRGSELNFGRNESVAVAYKPGSYRPFVRETLNDPLYAGAWDFSGYGGARAELGVFSTWEWWFWTSDTLKTWPSMEAQADNVFGSYGFQLRDNLASGEDALAPPNMYLKWDCQPGDLRAGKYGLWTGRPLFNDKVNNPVGQLHTIKREFAIANSHFPSSGIYSAYLVRPEKCFFDKQEQYTWFTFLSTQSSNIITAPSKTGVPGDAKHHIGYQVSNGNRTYAWPMREILRTAFLKFEGARRRNYWRRVAQDQADHFNVLCARTIWGAASVRGVNPDSDNWQTVPHWDGWGKPIYGSDWRAGKEMGPNGTIGLDAFKSAYINMTAMHGMDLGIADFAPGIQVNLWQIMTLEDAPKDKWFLLLGTSKSSTIMIKDCVLKKDAQGGGTLISESGKFPIWDRNDMKGLFAWLQSKLGDPAYKAALGLPEKIEDMQNAVLSVGYSFIKQQQVGLYMLLRYHADPAVRARAKYWIDRIDSTWPGDKPFNNGGPWLYSKNFQQLDMIPEEKI